MQHRIPQSPFQALERASLTSSEVSPFFETLADPSSNMDLRLIHSLTLEFGGHAMELGMMVRVMEYPRIPVRAEDFTVHSRASGPHEEI